MIKTFHVRTNLQLADVFTKALGVLVFMDLISRLGLINIFSTSITYPKSLQDTKVISTAEAALVLSGLLRRRLRVQLNWRRVKQKWRMEGSAIWRKQLHKQGSVIKVETRRGLRCGWRNYLQCWRVKQKHVSYMCEKVVS